MYKEWNKEEIDYLKMNYENNTNFIISQELKRSIPSIEYMACKLNLKKLKSHISKMISKRNKMTSRDLNYETLLQISIKYKTRSEFQKMDPSAYSSSRKLGILDQICSHMIKQSFSIPQLLLKLLITKFIHKDILYNTRSIISPYELDIFVPIYKIAFEYDGKRWHLNDSINKFELCNKKEILLITFKENSRNYDQDIKSQFIKNIDLINKHCGLVIKEEDIIDTNLELNDVDIIDEYNIMNICLKYTDFSIFRKENINLYNKLIKLKLINKFTKHMKKKGGLTDEIVINEIKKYEYLSDLLNNSYRFYIWIKKNKKEYLLTNLKLKQNKVLKGVKK